jgi:phage tail-like protein
VRGLVPELTAAYPLASQLPAVYQEDGFLQRFTSAFDATLAPVVSTLDDLSAYVDPRLTPPDFLSWLAGWVGAETEGITSLSRRRDAVARAVRLHRRRGTLVGIQERLELAIDGEVEVTDSGGAAWSALPDGELPGTEAFSLLVRVRVKDVAAVDMRHLEAVVSDAKPAHVSHAIEVLATEDHRASSGSET